MGGNVAGEAKPRGTKGHAVSETIFEGRDGLTISTYVGTETEWSADRKRVQLSAVTPEGERQVLTLTREQWAELRSAMRDVSPYAQRSFFDR